MEQNLPATEALFRTEALASRRETKWVGAVIVARPLSFDLAVGVAVLLVLFLALYCYFGSYTPRAMVTGQLIPEQGIAKMYAGQPGMIAEILVREGQDVKKGDVLFRVAGERKTGMGDSTDTEVAKFAGARRELLASETERQKELEDEKQVSLTQKIADLEEQLQKLDQRVILQKELVALSENTMDRYELLADQGYVSRQQFEQTKAAALQNRAALYGLERERIAAVGQLATAQSDLRTARLQARNQVSQMNRQLSSASQDVVESESRRLTAVVAPFDGAATAITAAVGEHVTPSVPVVSVVPSSAKLRAKLLVPSSAIGFVKKGDSVRLRYDAFPFQKFGSYNGIVVHVSLTSLAPADAAMVSGSPVKPESGPVYQVIVELESQFVSVYGQEERLLSGMMVSADILQDKRRIYQWLLKPLYTVRARTGA